MCPCNLHLPSIRVCLDLCPRQLSEVPKGSSHVTLQSVSVLSYISLPLDGVRSGNMRKISSLRCRCATHTSHPPKVLPASVWVVDGLLTCPANWQFSLVLWLQARGSFWEDQLSEFASESPGLQHQTDTDSVFSVGLCFLLCGDWSGELASEAEQLCQTKASLSISVLELTKNGISLLKPMRSWQKHSNICNMLFCIYAGDPECNYHSCLG